MSQELDEVLHEEASEDLDEQWRVAFEEGVGRIVAQAIVPIQADAHRLRQELYQTRKFLVLVSELLLTHLEKSGEINTPESNSLLAELREMLPQFVENIRDVVPNSVTGEAQGG